MENQNRRIFFSYFCLLSFFINSRFVETENSRFVENEKRGILFFRKIRIREVSLCGKRDSENSRFVENENSEICRKQELEKSRFVEN